MTWASRVSFSWSIRLPGVSFKPCSKPLSRPRPEDIQVFHSFFFREGARPSAEPFPVLSPTRRSSISPTGRLWPGASKLFSRHTLGRHPDAPPRSLSYPDYFANCTPSHYLEGWTLGWYASGQQESRSLPRKHYFAAGFQTYYQTLDAVMR